MSGDTGYAGDHTVMSVYSPASDSAVHHTVLHLERWDEDQVAWAARELKHAPDRTSLYALGVTPYADDVYHGNLVTTAGWQMILQSGNIYNSAVSAGTGGGTSVSAVLFSNTVGRIGVGSGTAAAAYGDTQLQTPLLYKFCGAAPTITITNSVRNLVFTATFQSADANGSWQEFGIDQGTADSTSVVAPFINHGIQNMGSKVSGQIWSATATISFT